MALDEIHPNLGMAADLYNRTRFTDLAYTAAAAQTAGLPEGVYDIWATTDCYVNIGPGADVPTTATGYILLANNVVRVVVRKDHKIGAVRSTADGTLSGHKVG